jgi:type III secretory pathway component EscS
MRRLHHVIQHITATQSQALSSSVKLAAIHIADATAQYLYCHTISLLRRDPLMALPLAMAS